MIKTGNEPLDPRLDLVFHKDPRSRNFAAVDRLTSTQETPRFRSYSVNRWLDQGQEGACVGFAFAHELCSTPLRIRKWRSIDYDYAWDIYHQAQHRDPWPGCNLGRNCTIQASAERYEGTSMLAGVKIVKDRGYIDEYRWAFGEEDLALAISHLGPAVIGVNWYEGMFSTNRHNYIEPSGRWMGGHAIVVNSVNPRFSDPDLQYYRLWNSWGPKWGRNGWCFISRKDMARLLSEDGEAVVPLIRNEL